MAFNVDDRVKVTAQNSQWRGHYGVVKAVDSGDNQVQLDGFQAGQTRLLTDNELMASSRTRITSY